MLPAPILPLAEHASLGQNCCDASIGSVVLFCISTSCRGPSIFSSFPPQFHRLVGLYPEIGSLRILHFALFHLGPMTSFILMKEVGHDVYIERDNALASQWFLFAHVVF